MFSEQLARMKSESSEIGFYARDTVEPSNLLSFIQTEQVKESEFVLGINKIEDTKVDVQNVDANSETYKPYTFLVEKNKVYTTSQIARIGMERFNNNFDYTHKVVYAFPSRSFQGLNVRFLLLMNYQVHLTLWKWC